MRLTWYEEAACDPIVRATVLAMRLPLPAWAWDLLVDIQYARYRAYAPR